MNYTTSKIFIITSSRITKSINLAFICLFALLFVAPAYAEDFWAGGRLKVGTGTYFDRLDDSSNGQGPAQFILELQAEWSPNDNVTIIGDVWLRGDRFYDLDDGEFRAPALQNFTSPQSAFLDRFGMSTSSNGTYVLPDPFGASGKENELLDDFDDELLRELSIRFASDDGSTSVKIGKFQRGWGQADGIRILDILNAQDLRQRTLLADSDEIRIPAWTIAINADITNNVSMELLYIPEVRHSEFIINNPTPNDQTSGGAFGFPFPRLIEGQTGFGMPLLGARLNEKKVKDWDNEEVALRLKFNALGGEATLNAFYGYQDLPVVVLTGATLHIGSFINDPAASVANVPLPVSATIGAIHAPGQYVDFIQSLAGGTAAPGDFPLIPFGCMDILNPAAGGLPCSVTADFDMDFTERQKTLGFSFSRDMSEWRFGPKSVSPVLRLEVAHEFDKAFNRQVIKDPFIPGLFAKGTPALIATKADAVTHRDQISTLIGVDYNLWLPGWKSQRSSIFITSQFFNIHTKEHENLMFQAPYALLQVEENQQYFTQTYTLGLLNDNVILDGLAVWDLSNDSSAFRQRITFSAMGNKLIPRIEVGIFDGEEEAGLLAFYRQSDYVELSLTYQF